MPAPLPLVLVHGALGAASTLAPLATALAEAGLPAVHRCELPGHGVTPLADDDGFSIAAFAAHLRAWLEAEAIGPALCFGYSMGGYVALHLAATEPGRLAGIVTLGTKLAWTPEGAAREAARLDPAVLRAKVPRFADALAARHADAGAWERCAVRTAALLRALGDAPLVTPATLAAIDVPVRLMVGDRDATVTLDETAAAMRALPHGELAVLPRTPHPLEQVDAARLAHAIADVVAAASGAAGAAGVAPRGR